MSVDVMPQPEGQWWTINGAELMSALVRAHSGDDPGIVYLELLANSASGDDSDGIPHE